MSRTRDRSHEYTFDKREEDARWRGSSRQPRRTLAPGETPCPGACNAAWRKQQRILDAHARAVAAWAEDPVGPPPKEPETRPLSPMPGDPVYCGRDQAVYRRLLSEVDDLAAIAARYNDGHRKDPDAERVSGSRGTRSPSATAEELDDIAFGLRSWEATARKLIRQQAGQPDTDQGTPPRRGYLASEITTTVSQLVAHFDVLITDRDAAEPFAAEISGWHEKLKRREKAGTGRRHMKRPCPRCERYSLYQEDDADYVACARSECGRLLSWQDWLDWDAGFGKTSAGAA